MQVEQNHLIKTEQQILNQFISMQKKCIMLENYQNPQMTVQQIIQRMTILQKSIQQLRIFSPNQTLKEVHTQYIRLLALPYHLGYLYGKVSENRKQSVLQSKNYLTAFLNLIKHFNSQEEQLFPKNVFKTYRDYQQQENYKISRDDLISSEKQKKLIRTRYQNTQKIKQQSEQRQSLKDFLSLQIYEAFTQLRSIKQELQILQYKDKLNKDPQFKEKHDEEQSKPLPKMKFWQIKKPEQISNAMLPPNIADFGKKRQDQITKVWQQNANKPTITLQEVADMQYQNMKNRSQREARQREANKEDSDSDKQQVDAKKKKKADDWELFKEHNQKGAGNKGR